MARSKRSSAKKAPATTKRRKGTAKAKGTTKRTTPRKASVAKKVGAARGRKGAPARRKTSQVKGKPRTASTRRHGGSSKAPKRAPAASAKRAAAAQSQADKAASPTGGTGGGDAPAAHRPERITVRNVNVPGYRSTVDGAKYEAMRSTLFAVLPNAPPGLTQSEMLDAVLPKLPEDHFPRGDKAMWWVKAVQLDQEAQGKMKRSATTPLRWWKS